MVKMLFPLMTLALACLPALAGGPPQKIILDPNQPYQARKSDPVAYDVDFSVVVTAPAGTKLLKVWLPLPQTDAAQQVSDSRLSTFPDSVAPKVAREKVFGNTFAYFEFTIPEAQIVRHKFKIKVWEHRWDIEPRVVQRVPKWPAGFAPYLKADIGRGGRAAEKDHQENRPRRQGPGQRPRRGHDLVQKNMKYDPSRASLKASSDTPWSTPPAIAATTTDYVRHSGGPAGCQRG